MRRVQCEMYASVNLGPTFSILPKIGRGWRGSVHIVVQQAVSHGQPKGCEQHAYESMEIHAREECKCNRNHADAPSRMCFVASTRSMQQRKPSLDTRALTRRQGNLPKKRFICGENVKHTRTLRLKCLSSNLALGTSLALLGPSNFNMV